MARLHNRNLLSIIFFLLLSLIFLPFVTYAQEDISYGVAQYIVIDGEDIEPGSIISSTREGFHVTQKQFDEDLFGVVAEKPAITFIDSDDNTDKYQVVTSGNSYVRVSLENGPIEKGDPITSSSTKGVGMLLTSPGTIIGTALEGFNSDDPQEIGLVNVKVQVRYYSLNLVSNSFFDIFEISLLTAARNQPPVFFRYFTAGFVIIGSMLLGFYYFGRVAAKGIEALGRNPMASRMIQLGILINVIVTLATIGAGLIIGIIILRL